MDKAINYDKPTNAGQDATKADIDKLFDNSGTTGNGSDQQSSPPKQ